MLNESKVFFSLLIWTADSTWFLSENHLNGCQIFGQVSFLKTESEPIFSFLHTPSGRLWVQVVNMHSSAFRFISHSFANLQTTRQITSAGQSHKTNWQCSSWAVYSTQSSGVLMKSLRNITTCHQVVPANIAGHRARGGMLLVKEVTNDAVQLSWMAHNASKC